MIKSIFVFLVCLFLLSSGAFLFNQDYLVHHYTEADGLPSAEVNDITQDQWGRIWFATRTGIAVYNGSTWEKYSTADGLPVLTFEKIRAEQEGRIWAVSRSSKEGVTVVYHDLHSENISPAWTQIKGPGAAHLESVYITAFQLVKQEEKAAAYTLAVGTMKHGLLLWNREKWLHYTENNDFISNCVYGMASLGDQLYVATDKGLVRVTVTSNPSINNRMNQSLGLPGKEIYGVGIQHNDKYQDTRLKYPRIWLYGQKWLGWFQGNNQEINLYPVKISLTQGGKKEDEIVKLLPDYRLGLYVGNKVSINYFNYKDRTWETIGARNNLITDGTNALFVDWEKNIWIASRRGVSKISSRRFSSFQGIHGLLEDEVTAVLEYQPGKFALGHNHGITLYDINMNRFQIIPLFQAQGSGQPLPRIMEMQLDSKGNIWAAAAGPGVVKLFPGPTPRVTTYGQTHGLTGNVTSLWINKDKNNHDRVWVLAGGEVFVHTPNRQTPKQVFSKVLLNASPPLPSCRRIYGSLQKLLFITCFNDGIYVNTEGVDHPGAQWRNYRIPGDSNANSVYAVKKDSRGRIFIGTLGGLYILENERLKKFKDNDFQVDRAVYFILEDTKNRLWFGTDNGVICWDGKGKRSYTTNEGLIGHETNRAAAIVDSKGRIWMGTNRGVSIYNEAFDHNDRFNPPPKVQLLSLGTTTKQIPLQEKTSLRLAHDENTLDFHFLGVSFLNERAVRFNYRLEGFETEWSEEKYLHDQMVRYTNLPPGTYRFHLKARNALGVWSEVVTSPEIIIPKAFYKKWWFHFVMILSIITVFYGIFRFFSQKRYAALLERKVEERTHQLQTAEQQYRSLFEESKDVVFITTPEGKIIDINPAGVELFGAQSREDVLALDSLLTLYNHPKDRDAFREAIESNGYVKDYELVLKRNSGELVTVLVTANLVQDKEGKIIAYRGILKDISRQKKLEQQLLQAQKMEAIGTLAGGIAHDFNNIMGMIVWHTESLRDDTPAGVEGESMRQKIDHVLSAAERGTELVKQILTISRQQDKAKRHPVNLSTVVADSLKLLRSSLPATIEIRQEIQPSCFVLADTPQLHQIMMNMGTNAAHAMREHGGILEIKLEEVELDEEAVQKLQGIKPGAYLELTVSDTGHGMIPEVRARIFEPYFSTKKKGEGTGMGLAVTQGIVKNLGGDITVNTQPAKGTTFHVYLPKFKGKIKTKTPVVSSQEVTYGKESILLVDDEVELVESGGRLLKHMGYHIVGKTCPTKALETFKKNPQEFHLVITDLTMPQMTGIQLAEEIKRIKPDIPIILLSGFSFDATAEQIESSNINDFLTKPVSRNDLARIIRKVLDNKEK